MTTFHIIHLVAGAWLILGPLMGFLDTYDSLYWNSIIFGIVVGAYNFYYLFAKKNVDVTTEHS